MPKWAAITLAFVLASAPPLQAAEVGSTELVRQCKYPRQGKRSIDENADALQCLSYINGFLAGASIVAGPRPFCIPATATLVQEADAYLAWAGKHADMLTQPTYVTLQRALAEAFPARNRLDTESNDLPVRTNGICRVSQYVAAR